MKPRLLLVALLATAIIMYASKGEAMTSAISDEFDKSRYPPNDPETVKLFSHAANVADLPQSWANDADLHWILGKESGGWVGRPNYTIPGYKDASQWRSIWDRLKTGEIWTKSTATGLGQLLTSNVKKLYPDGLDGIGDPVNEAVGFMLYISNRYGSPKVAREMYGKQGEYTNARTGQLQHKGFTEGY